MTEKEMLTKYCQQSGPGPWSKCLGSSCAAWRWKKVPNPDYKPSMMNVYPQPWPTTSMHIYSDTDGYCGLAGQL
jgi:hypothetical protein